MPSQNESIVWRSKAALLGCLIGRKKINVGAIIYPEMILRARQHHTSLPFPLLITALCRKARVPFDPKTDIEVAATSSCDIRWIEAEDLKDEEE